MQLKKFIMSGIIQKNDDKENELMIQMDEADRLEKKWSGGKCNHIWEKELYLGTKTGDYRCSICGATCSEIDMKKLQSNK